MCFNTILLYLVHFFKIYFTLVKRFIDYSQIICKLLYIGSEQGTQQPMEGSSKFHPGDALGGDNIIFCLNLAVKEDFDTSQDLPLFHRGLHFGQQLHFAGQVVPAGLSTRIPFGASAAGSTVGSAPCRTGMGASRSLTSGGGIRAWLAKP